MGVLESEGKQSPGGQDLVSSGQLTGVRLSSPSDRDQQAAWYPSQHLHTASTLQLTLHSVWDTIRGWVWTPTDWCSLHTGLRTNCSCSPKSGGPSSGRPQKGPPSAPSVASVERALTGFEGHLQLCQLMLDWEGRGGCSS